MRLKHTIALLTAGISFCCQLCYAQISLKLLYQIDTPAVQVNTDNLDNIYVITNKDQLFKYNASGRLLWNYSNKSFGELRYVDVTDPMRILLFYPALPQVLVLNNNLSEISRFNFANDASKLITLIATSNSNGYWIYDQLNRSLQKLSNQFNDEQISSGDIFQQTGLSLKPELLKAIDQHVFLYSSAQGILQFDRFGAYLRLFKTGRLNDFQVKETDILFLQDRQWKSLNTKNSTETILYNFKEPALQVSEGNKILAVRFKNRIEVYAISEAH